MPMMRRAVFLDTLSPLLYNLIYSFQNSNLDVSEL